MKLLFVLIILLCSPYIFAQNSLAELEQINTGYLWRQALGGGVIGLPSVQAQSVVVIQDGGSVKAYSVSGRPLWSFSVRGKLCPFITRSREGTSYICGINGIFIAINRIGRELWRVNLGGALSGPMVLGWDGRIFVPAAKKIFCYTASGNLLWTQELEEEISAGPCPDQAGGILLALQNGDALSINHFGAKFVRRLPSVPRILLSAGQMVLPGNSRVPPALVLYRNGDAQMIDFSGPDNTLVDLPGLPAPPLAAAGRGANIAVTLAGGQVLLMAASDGTVRWTADSHIRIQQERGAAGSADTEAVMIYNERGIYVLTASGATSFTGDGKRLWFTSLKNAAGLPAFDENGVLYSGGTDWVLYAWKLEDRAMRQKQSLYGPAPDGSYGTGNPLPSSLFAEFSEYIDEDIIQNELETIHRGILAGRVGENESEWLAYLKETAACGYFQGLNRPLIRADQRILALQLLSRIGSAETIPWLTRFFRREGEPLVKAAAALAIGGIGTDPDGIAIREFLAAVGGGNPDRDERVLVSVAAGTGELCRFSGPPLFATGVRILVFLSNPDQPPSVQRQARRELNNLLM